MDAHAAVQAASIFVSANYTPPKLNRRFTPTLYCDGNADWRLRVIGARNPGLTQHQFNLHDQSTHELLATRGQRSTSTDTYERGPYDFDAILEPGKSYYVKRGVWDSCQPWQEHRIYDLRPTISCIDAENYALAPVYQTTSSGQQRIVAFQITGSNAYPIDRIEYSIRVDAASAPVASTASSPVLPAGIPYLPAALPGAGGPHSCDARIYFANGKTKTLHWE